MNLIVAVSKNFGIGKNNHMLFHLPTDLKYFKEKTLNKVVVMGKKTYFALPKRPLPDRVNIVLSSDLNFNPPGVTVVRNLKELLAEIKKFDDDKVFICGGAQIYNLLMDYCETAYITFIDEIVPADTFINNIEEHGFILKNVSPKIMENQHSFDFRVYKNPKHKKIDLIGKEI